MQTVRYLTYKLKNSKADIGKCPNCNKGKSLEINARSFAGTSICKEVTDAFIATVHM